RTGPDVAAYQPTATQVVGVTQSVEISWFVALPGLGAATRTHGPAAHAVPGSAIAVSATASATTTNRSAPARLVIAFPLPPPCASVNARTSRGQDMASTILRPFARRSRLSHHQRSQRVGRVASRVVGAHGDALRRRQAVDTEQRAPGALGDRTDV